MTKKVYVLYILAILLLPLLLLSIIKLKSPNELIRPPGAYGTAKEINEAFLDSLPEKEREGAVLKYPSSGKYSTAFILKNLDGDEEREAIVFYSTASDESTVRMNVLDFEGGRWKSVYDEPGYGNEIVSVEFDDFDRNGESELLCMWGLYDEKSSGLLSVYSVSGGGKVPIQLNVLVTQPLQFFKTADVNGDGFDELLFTYSDTEGKSPDSPTKNFLSVLKMKDGSFVSLGTRTELDFEISSYYGMKLQDRDGEKVLFVDAFKGQDSMITELLSWDSDTQSFINNRDAVKPASENATLRSPALPSLDYDGDGYIDIPACAHPVLPVNPPEKDEANAEKAMPLFCLKNFRGGAFVTKDYAFINRDGGFFLKVPKELRDSLFAFRTESGVMTVYKGEKEDEKGEALLSLMQSSKDKKLQEKYTVMIPYPGKSRGYAVCGTLTGAGRALGFSDEGIRESLVFVREVLWK